MPVAVGEVDKARRARRFELASWRRANAIRLDSKGAASCMRAHGDVSVAVSTAGQAHIGGGIARCGSIASCPTCGPVMRERRAIEIDEACQAHLAQGGTVWLVTLTVPHSRTDAFLDVLDRLQDLYRDTFSGRSGRQLRKDLDVVGLIRAWDITYGVRNGWHPHMHVLFFAQGDRFNGQALCAAWEAAFTARGYDYVPTVSADFRQVNVTDGASGYVAKADGGWGAGLELARTDLKRGAGMTPQQLLELASTGEARWVRLWAEYEKGMFRRRVIQWTPGLRKRLGLGEIATDEQAAEGLAPDEVVCVLLVTRTTWNRYRQAGQLARLLQLLEGGQLPDGVYGCTGDPP